MAGKEDIILTQKQINRFWSKVDKQDPGQCWPWLAGKSGNGYGQVSFRRRCYKAHRIAYFLAKGDIPVGLCVCHTCDNPACCNPAHLWLGTQADNNRDKILKGRANMRFGSKHHNHKLTELDVIQIRKLYNTQTQQQISEQFGVSYQQVSKILNNKQWGHLK